MDDFLPCPFDEPDVPLTITLPLMAGVAVGTAGATCVLPFTGLAFEVRAFVPCAPLTTGGGGPVVLETIGGVYEDFFVA